MVVTKALMAVINHDGQWPMWSNTISDRWRNRRPLKEASYFWFEPQFSEEIFCNFRFMFATSDSDRHFEFLPFCRSKTSVITLLVESLCQTSDTDKSDKSDFPMDGSEDISSLTPTSTANIEKGKMTSSLVNNLSRELLSGKVRRT